MELKIILPKISADSLETRLNNLADDLCERLRESTCKQH